MSESRIRIGVGVGLGLGLGLVLWMIWPDSTTPAAPAPVNSVDEVVAGIELAPTPLSISDAGPGEIARKSVPETAPRLVQVLDARTLEPVQGASVAVIESSVPSFERMLELMGKLRSAPNPELANPIALNHISDGTRFSLGDDRSPEPSITDAGGMATMIQGRESILISASYGPSQGSTRITAAHSTLQVLIEPPISIRVLDAYGNTASSRRVVAYLYADGDRKGPLRPRLDPRGNAVLISLWQELRTWLADKPYEEVGILIGFASHPDQPGVWLPIEAPVPNPVVLYSPPPATREAKGR